MGLNIVALPVWMLMVSVAISALFLMESRAQLEGKAIKFYCTKEEMVLLIEKNFTAGDHTDITLRNTSCHADHNQTHFILTSMFHDCGMRYAQSNDEIVYQNVATISPRLPENTLIIRELHVDKAIELKCIFKRGVSVTTGVFTVTGVVYGEWANYSECSKTCGGGVQTRRRDCLSTNVTSHRCDNASTVQTRGCNTEACVLACADLKCNQPFTACNPSKNAGSPAVCACKPAYVNLNGACRTADRIVKVVAFKLNVTFQSEYTDLNNPRTKRFTDALARDIHATLDLARDEYIKVTRLKKGSIFADFIVLLKNQSLDNRTTVYRKLYNEIKTNETGHLFEYFPVADQVVVVVGSDICALDSDNCNKTSSDCEPTPGVGLNFRCNCKPGYIQFDDYTCIEVPPVVTTETPDTSGDANVDILTISLICIGVGLLILLTCLLCLLLGRRRRRRYEEATEAAANGSNQGYDTDSVLEDEKFKHIVFMQGGRRLRATDNSQYLRGQRGQYHMTHHSAGRHKIDVEETS